MRRLILAFAVLVLTFALVGGVGAQEPASVEPTPSETATPEPTPEPLRNGCARLFTRAQHRSYTRKVYRYRTIRERHRERIRTLRRCQSSAKKQKAARKLELHQKKKRYRRLHILCGTPRCNKNLGRIMAAKRGWTGRQFSCLDGLWGGRESGWNQYADNPTSDAYGIPQALPGWKMGPGWQSVVRVQIRWGLGYIRGRYGTPCGALAHSHARNWY